MGTTCRRAIGLGMARTFNTAFSALVGGAILSLSSVLSASATTYTIPLSYSYNSYSDPNDANYPDFYTQSLPFNLPAGYTNASLNITALQFDDRGVVQLNGVTVTSSGITNNLGLVGQMVFTAGGTPVPWTFEYGFVEATTFAPITTGFQTGLNTIELIVNDTSGGLNFRDGLLSGGYYWFTGACYDTSGCFFTEERNGIKYYRGYTFPPTSALFVATVTYDLADNVSQTPLPAALPLFVSGLGGLGYLARRRRKRSVAA
jgi:hypothetical protein